MTNFKAVVLTLLIVVLSVGQRRIGDCPGKWCDPGSRGHWS